MFSGREIKDNPELKALARYYTAKLFLTFNGSLQTYLAITQDIHDKEKKHEAWETYNAYFNEKILVSLLEVFDSNHCGVAEVCTAVLKLLELAGASVAEVEQESEEEARTIKYWEEHFANR